MEAGKPGWYDALNGLPGLFGSSTAESSELWRLLHFLCAALEEAEQALTLPSEMNSLAQAIYEASRHDDPMLRWKLSTSALEEYRAQTLQGMSESSTISSRDALSILSSLEARVSAAVHALLALPGVMPTYFTNLPCEWYTDEKGIHPTAFVHRPLPPFLEGPMHALRLPISSDEKERLIQRIHQSVLYDQKLRMYKVSADLSHETPELGRANAFTRGWLEHESIWLHMEYKYLLELLKNGFYDAFFTAFSDALIPFQPPERYGRSVLENSSFLASSANPDPSTHGRGFVARLSGATAEFLDMWQIMFFGKQPFKATPDGLTLTLMPVLAARLIPKSGSVTAMFLGRTPVIYHLPQGGSVTPATHRVQHYTLIGHDGSETTVCSSHLCDAYARRVRSGQYAAVHVWIVPADT